MSKFLWGLTAAFIVAIVSAAVFLAKSRPDQEKMTTQTKTLPVIDQVLGKLGNCANVFSLLHHKKTKRGFAGYSAAS